MDSVTFTLIVGLFGVLFLYNWWRMSYWAKRGVPSPPAIPFIGHFHHLTLNFSHRYLYVDKWYRKFRHSKLIGFYELLKPTLLVYDLDDLKNVFVKDFDYFVDRRVEEFENYEVFGEMIGVLSGDAWKALRTIITPAFSSGKMKNMFPLVEEKADILLDKCKKLAGETCLDIRDLFGRFTMDVIASCCFGIECNSLTDNEARFPKEANNLFSSFTIMNFKSIMVNYLSSFSECLRIKLSLPEIQFFQDVLKHTISKRTSNDMRGDFLDLMLQEKQKNDMNQERKYPVETATVISQSVVFLVAGFETTANTLSFTAFALAKYPEHQERLRQELKDLEQAGKFNYQGIMEAKFLEACISESLRLWPVVHFVDRVCTRDYRLPGTEVIIKKGDILYIPVWSIHHDPAYWEDPEEFKPARFLPENKGNVVHYSYMPFGIGPRNCIGMRFAQMEIKLALAKILLEYELQVAPGYQEIEIEKHPFFLRPSENGIRVVIKPLEN